MPLHVDAEERFEGVGFGEDVFLLEFAAQFFYKLWGGGCNSKIVYMGAEENLTRGCDESCGRDSCRVGSWCSLVGADILVVACRIISASGVGHRELA